MRSLILRYKSIKNQANRQALFALIYYKKCEMKLIGEYL